MRQENIQILEDNYGFWITLRDADYMRGLNSHQLDGLVKVMQEEFIPGYVCDLWCPSCVAEMLRNLYTRYDAWKAAQPKEEPIPEPVVEAEEPIIVQASFPAQEPIKNNLNQNKKHHRKK